MAKSNLIQIKIRNSKGYDIIKQVYMDEVTGEINIVDSIKEENYIPPEEKSILLNTIISTSDEELFEKAIKYFHLKPYATVFYSRHLNRMIASTKEYN